MRPRRSLLLVVLSSLFVSFTWSQTPKQNPTDPAQNQQKDPPDPKTELKTRPTTARTAVCQPWDKSEAPNTFCGFLRYNYDSLQKVCGLAPTRSWLHWFGDSDPIKAIPPRVLSSMVSQEADVQKQNFLILEDTTSLSRLLTYAGPLLGSDNKLIPGAIAQIESPSSVNSGLQFSPTLDPEIMLVPGSGNVVHTLSCSDVWSAMVSSGVSFNMTKAAAKISAEDDTATTYKLVYGLFKSPMAYMADEYPDTFYFETLDWYIRAANTGNPPGQKGPNYLQSIRGIAIYSTLKSQTKGSGNLSASAGFSSPLFSIDGSASNNATSTGELSTQVFHILLGDSSVAMLPSFSNTVAYLGGLHAVPKSSPAFDSGSGNLALSVQIEGMPHSLCRRDSWTVVNKAKDGSSTGHPSLALVNAIYHKPGESVSASSVRTRSECEFQLSADADPNDTSNFSGALSPNIDKSITPSLAIQFSVSYSLPDPKLRSLDVPPDKSNNEGDWNFQIINANGIDKNVDPDTKDLVVTCNPALSVPATTNATFQSAYKNAKGSYLRIHALLSPSTVSVNNCQLSGQVDMVGTNGLKIAAKFQASSGTQPEAQKQPAPSQKGGN